MNIHHGTSQDHQWQLPETSVPFKDGPGRTAKDFETWVKLVTRIYEIAVLNGWSKTKTAEQIGMPTSTFSGWYQGTYQGRFDRHNEAVGKYVALYDRIDEGPSVPQSPDFLQTHAARVITDTLFAAQIMPALVMVTGAAGIGKTASAEHFAASRPHTHLATISPHTRTVHAMLTEIAFAVGVRSHNPTRLVRSIGERLERKGAGTLLIVDEAQNLVDDAINQLRHFVDQYRCGVAVLGNTETYSRFSTSVMDGSKYGQLRRRIFKRVKIDRPRKDDLLAFIKAWGVTDQEQITFLTGVGMKPGALGQIDMTIKVAMINAAGDRKALTLDHLKWAWENRDVEGLG
ncbi:AAA family ATPase [Oceaniradius stylonematis]|uniref:AAA family ATPase n=1 Tax=Oceaniradius stylonematis TaxID=2184161 RepID=UPI00273F3BFC|nr:AAA family ATPase [Oceaniradius stylonematis]